MQKFGNAKRIPYYDFIRGLAIIMVIGIHTYPTQGAYGNDVITALYVLLRNMLNCAVPLFLAISGFFIAKKTFASAPDKINFWRKQIPKVYIPCLIFSLYWFVNDCMSKENLGGVVKALIYYLLCDYSIYYFIALIIECYLFAPFLYKHNNKLTLSIIGLVCFTNMFIIEYFKFSSGLHLPRIIGGSVLTLLFYFSLGYYISKLSRNYTLFYPLVLIIIGLSLCFMHTKYIYNVTNSIYVGQKASLLIYNMGIILLLFSSKLETLFSYNIITRLIIFIGEISFGIYFTHVFVLELMRYYFPQIQLHWAIFWTFTLIFTIGFVVLVKNIAPDMSKKYLGFR